ncbi:MAG: DUF5131 family protein [Candidatus Coproplasma sp.]
MKKTKIDWCDCTVNPVVGCPNGCEYCYAEKINCRFYFVKNWKQPEFFPDRLKQFESKTPKSVFIDSMSDFGCWRQEWVKEVLNAIKQNSQHNYIVITKKFDNALRLIDYVDNGIYKNLFMGVSICTQIQANRTGYIIPHFYSIEPILEPINIPDMWMAKTIIIGAETGNRKGKVIPKKEWIDSLVKQADRCGSVVFMKESLRKIMGDDFRQDKLPWSF